MKQVVAAAVVLVVVLMCAAFAWSVTQVTVGPISVTATLTSSTARGVPPPGRKSDGVEQRWRITDRNGRSIGRMLLQCRWITRFARLCYGTIQMPRGTFTFQGASPTSFQGEFAVTGGTGAYLGAGGTMRFTAIGQRKNALLVTITT